MRAGSRNQWDALREWTAGAPSEVRAAAYGNPWQWAEPLSAIPWEMLDSDAALRDAAERYARRCASARVLDGMLDVAASAGVQAPPEKLSGVGRVARLTCPLWWRRRLRRAWFERAEETLRSLGLVHRGRAPYVTHWTRRRRRGQKRAMHAALASATLTNENGEQLALFDAWKGSVANPAVRRHELMARLRGFERVAADVGHVARFYTLTTPSAFHPWTTVNGAPAPNPRYAGGTVADARRWMMRIWARIRAKLKRLSVLVYGFRISEPHHDGTPHMHALLWMPAHDAERVDFTIRGYLLSEYADEPGADRHRFSVEAIDPAKGSAVGYVAKYIAKNVDGFQVGEDYESGDADGKRSAKRVDAWAATYRIRQFQQIGGPPVGLWREFRRMRAAQESEAIERARSAADAGDWAAFVRALGGIDECRGAPVRLWTERTGEVNRYGEPRGPVPAGISGPDGRVRTRLHSWRVRWGARSGAPPWTRGNNCTRPASAGEGACSIESTSRRPNGRSRSSRRGAGAREPRYGPASAAPRAAATVN